MGIQDSAIEQMMANNAAMQPMQKEQMQFGLDSARAAYGQSQDDRQFALSRRGILAASQDQMGRDAAQYSSEDMQNQMASQGLADVNQGFANARAQQTRGLSRRGINPSSGAALAMENQMSMAQAGQQAQASNMARSAARDLGFKLTDRASNALAGYPSMASGLSGSGAGFGASGLGIANMGLSGMNAGWGQAGEAAGNMGRNATNMYSAEASYKSAQDKIAADSNPMNSIAGAVAGVATSKLMSDRRLKTDITAVGHMENGLTVYRYRYKAGGPMQLGVMADEVSKVSPSAVHRMPNGFDAVDYSKL